MQFATYEQTHKTLCKDTIHILNTELITQVNLSNFVFLFKFENYYKKVKFLQGQSHNDGCIYNKVFWIANFKG